MTTDSDQQFEGWAQEFGTDLYRYGVWLCKDPALADDLVQETFLRAWRARDKLRDVKAVKPWLITILRREYARTFERKVPEFRDVDDVVVADDRTLEPEDRTELRLIREGILALDKKYREPLMLQVILGLSCEEIAQELGITRSAVMTQVFRARQKLKVALGDEAVAEL